MTKEREALKLALEALQDYVDEYGPWSDDSGAQYVLRVGKEALAQPEQEPVAWRGYNWGHSPDDWVYRDFDDPILDGNGNNVGQPLYTAPQRKPLTDEQIHGLNVRCYVELTTDEIIEFARAIEAAHGIKENT